MTASVRSAALAPSAGAPLPATGRRPAAPPPAGPADRATIRSEPRIEKEPSLSSEGLSEDPAVYRSRLAEQSDEQLDAWMIEYMRDMSIRRGVLGVLADFRRATGLDDTGIERVFTAGGGARATIGRTAEGELMVPAISLHFLIPGLRSQSRLAREQEIDFLVHGFEQVVYI
jgi:hypothetical protein